MIQRIGYFGNNSEHSGGKMVKNWVSKKEVSKGGTMIVQPIVVPLSSNSDPSSKSPSPSPSPSSSGSPSSSPNLSPVASSSLLSSEISMLRWGSSSAIMDYVGGLKSGFSGGGGWVVDGTGSGEIDGAVILQSWWEGVGMALWDVLQDSDAKPKEPHVIGVSCVIHGVPGMNYRAISTCKWN